MEIVITILLCLLGLDVLVVIVKLILEVKKEYKQRHHNNKKSICKNCKHNKTRARKMYNYNRYTTEEYCDLKECINDKKEV
jgi:hypothetical protein